MALTLFLSFTNWNLRCKLFCPQKECYNIDVHDLVIQALTMSEFRDTIFNSVAEEISNDSKIGDDKNFN